MKVRWIYGIILLVSMMTMFIFSGCGGCSCGEGSCTDGVDKACYYCGGCTGCISGCMLGGCGCIWPYETFMFYGNGYLEGHDTMLEACADE